MMTKFIIDYNNRRDRTIGWRTWTIHRYEEIIPAIQELINLLEAAGYSSKDTFAVRLSLEEALVNAIKHGHNGDPSKEVQLRCHLAPKYLLAEIEDQGRGFKPEAVPDPFAAENCERPFGRGLLLMRNFMTWVRFNKTGNRVTMCRRRLSAGTKKASGRAYAP
jgi:serine/threonine-protein kinase RsbW